MKVKWDRVAWLLLACAAVYGVLHVPKFSALPKVEIQWTLEDGVGDTPGIIVVGSLAIAAVVLVKVVLQLSRTGTGEVRLIWLLPAALVVGLLAMGAARVAVNTEVILDFCEGDASDTALMVYAVFLIITALAVFNSTVRND